MVIEMQTIETKQGVRIPQMGFGTYGLEEEATEAILYALEAGYRHIDTADVYGSHANVAEAIQQSGIDRQELFINTKIWKDDLAEGKVQPAIERFLDELQTDYLDMLLIHRPVDAIPLEETLGAMEAARQDGLVRHLGVSNFSVKHLKAALETGYEIVNNQVEYNFDKRPDDIYDFCQKEAISFTAYSPLGEGDSLDAHEAIGEMAEKYDVSKAEVLLRWLMQKGMIVIPRSTSEEHIQANFHALEWELDQEDFERLEQMD